MTKPFFKAHKQWLQTMCNSCLGRYFVSENARLQTLPLLAHLLQQLSSLQTGLHSFTSLPRADVKKCYSLYG
eukprot:3006848-Amphidinium_carterae.1